MQRTLIRRTVGVLIGLTTAMTVSGTSFAVDEPADETVVETSDGAVRGMVTEDHKSFLGIPFAAAPVGERRWRSPEPVEPWTDIRDATAPGAQCPQLGGRPAEPPTVAGSEDCLFVNVTVPRHADGPLPVMVFMHGGSFVIGSGATYDPTRIAAQGDVIVVTANYRLGALGFLAHPGMTDPAAGNFGLADQQAALRWVSREIAAFGGDPGNVTLWGQSAGAFTTCAQLASPGARGLFDKAIVQSGPCGNPLGTVDVAQQRGLSTATTLGCDDPATALDCLRGKPLDSLVGLAQGQAFSVHSRIADLPWLPVAGTPILPLQPLQAMRDGVAADVPLIQGGTRDEMRSFVGSNYDGAGRPVTVDQYPAIIREMFGPTAGTAILARYPADAYPTPSLALATVLTDDGGMLGTCSQLAAAQEVARRSDAYVYEFAEPTTDSIGDFSFGASHGSDLRYFFDLSFGGYRPPPPAGDQKVLADTLIEHWTTFARTGHPAEGWPAFAHGTALSFSTAQIEPIDVAREHGCDFWRPWD